MKVTFAGNTFKTKKDAHLFFGSWLKNATPVEVIQNSNGFNCLYELLLNHPESDQKIGCGVDRFEIRVNPEFKGNNSFYLIRNDGSETDFSFRSCLSGKKKTEWGMFCSAARALVAHQVILFKADAFKAAKPSCGITGEPVDRNNCHVDHVVPFVELLRKFIEENNIRIAVKQSADCQILPEFEDDDLATEWIEFHRVNAELRVTTVAANLSRSKNK